MAEVISLEFVPLVESFLARVRELAAQAQQALLPLEQGEELRLDISRAEASLVTIRDQLIALGSNAVEVRFDETRAEAGIEALRARLVELQEVAQVAVDPGPAVAGLEAIGAAVAPVAAALGELGVVAEEAGGEVATAAAAAEPGLANLSALAYRAANAVDQFATRAATAAEVTPNLSLLAGRAAASVEELAAAMRDSAASGGPASPSQVATLETLTASLQQAQASLAALKAAQLEEAGAASQSAGANTSAGAAIRSEGGAAAEAAPQVNSLTSSLGGLRQMAIFYLALRVERALSGLFGSALEAEEGMDRISAAFEHATGTAAKAGQEIDFVRKLSGELGAPFKEAALAFGQFEETMKGSEVPLAVQRDLFVGVAAATTALRLPAKEAQAALEDFSRAGNRAEVQLRQLVAINRAIPGSSELVAHALFQGTDALAQFEAEVKKGNITVGQFFAALGPAYAREFGDKLPAAVGSTRAELNRLETTEFELAATTAKELTPALRGAVDALNDLLKASPETATGLGAEMAKVIEILQAMIAEFVAGVKFLEVPIFGFGTIINEVAFVAVHALRSVAEATPGLGGVGRTLAGIEQQLAINSMALKEETEGLVDEAGRLNQIAANATGAFLGMGDGARRAAGDLSLVKGVAGEVTAAIKVQEEAILRGIAAIEKQADAIGRTGPVERQAADDLVEAIDKQRRAIAELPVAERKALADREAELDQLRAHYQVFTDAYVKLQERQEKAAEALAAKEAKLFKEREDALLKFLGKIQADEDKAAAERAKKAGDLSKSLGTQKGRLGDLENKPGGNTVDEINEMDALRESIRKTEDEAKKLKDAQIAVGDAGARAGSEAEAAIQKVRNGFAQTIAEDDKLREAISQLGPAARSSLGAVLENLARLKGEGGLTEDDLRAGFSAIVGIFTAAGVSSAGLADRVAALTHQSRDLRETLAGVKTATQEVVAAQDKAAGSQATAAAASRESGAAHGFNAEKAKEDAAATGQAAAAEAQASEISIKRAGATSGLNEQLRIKTTLEPQLAGEIDKTTTAQEKATKAQEGATAGTISFRGEVVELSQKTAEATAPSGGIMKMGDKVVEIGKSATATAKSTKDLASGAEQAGQALDHTATAADKAGTAVGQAGGHLADLRDAAAGSVDAVSGIGTGLSGIATGAQKVPGALQPIVILLGQLTGLKADEYLDRASTALVDMGPAAREVAAALKDLLKVDFQKLKDGFSFLPATHEAAAALVVDLKDVVQLLKDVKTCQDALQT